MRRPHGTGKALEHALARRIARLKIGLMTRIAPAALAYAVTVFAIGFLLGTIRVLALGPLIGTVPAVAVELPLILAASLAVAVKVVRRWQVPEELAMRLALGALALAFLLVLELTVSLVLFGNRLDQHLANYLTVEAMLGLGGQLVFAALPALLLLMPQRR